MAARMFNFDEVKRSVFLLSMLYGSYYAFLLFAATQKIKDYRKISNIRRTKSQTINASHLVLKSSLPNHLKPGVKSRIKM